jgi:hypothetical protein
MFSYFQLSLLTGFMAFIWGFSEFCTEEYFGGSKMIQPFVFYFFQNSMETMISIPFGYYDCFFIEEKYGTCKQVCSKMWMNFSFFSDTNRILHRKTQEFRADALECGYVRLFQYGSQLRSSYCVVIVQEYSSKRFSK